MADLLLCNNTTPVPYYLEGIALNVYSLEELSYYIMNNAEMLEQNFMNQELVAWIGRDLGRRMLSEKLGQILEGERRLSVFVSAILQESGYCTPEETQTVLRLISEMEERTPFERSKLVADRMMQQGRILNSVYEYRRLIESREFIDVSALMQGSVWHNLGTAYARMYLFDLAEDCYRKAYSLNEDLESLKSFFYLLATQGDALTLQNEAEDYHVDDVTLTAWKNEFALRNPGTQKEAFDRQLAHLDALRRAGKNAAYREEADGTLQGWKEEYRRLCGA